MVKVFALIPQRKDVTVEFFHQHWAGPHAEVSKRITTLLRYVQTHRIRPGVTGLAEAPYEGIAEVWFTDFATAAGMGEDPNYVNGAHADEPNFIDTDNLAFVIANEEVVRAGGPVAQDDGGAKVMLLLRRSGGSGADFASAIGSSASALADAAPTATRVTVSTAVEELYADGGEPPYDGIVEFWFEDAAAAASAWETAGPALLAQLGSSIDASASAAFVGEELRVIWPADVPATA